MAALADEIADGVRSVRFAEVDVRRLEEPDQPVASAAAGRHRPLAGADELAGYDGLVLGVASGAEIPSAIDRLLAAAEELRANRTLSLSVGSAFVGGADVDEARWTLLRAVSRLGVVLVPAGVPGTADGHALGHRVAHVVSWITHARSHHHH